MLIWLVFDVYGSVRDRAITSSLIAWIAVGFLALLTVGFPK